MVGSVNKRYLEINGRIASEHPAFAGVSKALFDGRPELLRNIASDDLRLEQEAFSWLQRFDNIVDFTKLTRTTRLLFVRIGIFDAG